MFTAVYLTGMAVDRRDVMEIAITLAVLLVIGFGVLLAGRIWFRRSRDDSEEGAQVPFTIDQLRRMQSEGEISEQEYNTLHKQMVRQTRQKADNNQ